VIEKTKAAALDRLMDAGAAHYAAGRLTEAARAYAEAERVAPRDFRPAYSLAVIDIGAGRLTSAVTRLKRALKLNPTLFPALFNLGSVNQTLGHWAAAADAYARALALRPEAADVRFALASALSISGRIDEGAAQYRALAGDAQLGPGALARLALMRPGTVSAGELARMGEAAADAQVAADMRIALRFAEGEVLEARGRYDDAFAAFEAGNRMQHAALAAGGPASDPAMALRDHARSIERLQALFTPEFLAAHRGAGDESVRPIFIVGMPRSGSTLIEQILASHPAVAAMGESGVLAETLAARGAYDPGRTDKALIRGVAEDYLAAMRARGWTRKTRIVDKTLENYLHVGMIQLVFPRAVILHSVRDPLDTCVACYRQLFTSGNETLYDLAEIGESYRGYRRMMDHWARVLPGRVIDVANEALVADPEAQIRWLVTEACGLPWDPACLAFHETERAITTASAAQVRQPIFTSSLQRWRRYEGRLGPLIKALGEDAKT
jgi:tetratricopeptide (TPR) repeat protein